MFVSIRKSYFLSIGKSYSFILKKFFLPENNNIWLPCWLKMYLSFVEILYSYLHVFYIHIHRYLQTHLHTRIRVHISIIVTIISIIINTAKIIILFMCFMFILIITINADVIFIPFRSAQLQKRLAVAPSRDMCTKSPRRWESQPLHYTYEWNV